MAFKTPNPRFEKLEVWPSSTHEKLMPLVLQTHLHRRPFRHLAHHFRPITHDGERQNATKRTTISRLNHCFFQLPERQETPITAHPKSEIEPKATLITEEAEESLDNSNDFPDTDAESSDISETSQHPPPALKVGDMLLFLKKREFVHEKYATEPNSVIDTQS